MSGMKNGILTSDTIDFIQLATAFSTWGEEPAPGPAMRGRDYSRSRAMGVILQAVYKLPNGHTVASPFDGNRRIPLVVGSSGFPSQRIPPGRVHRRFCCRRQLKTNAGAFPGADGYGPFDDYDLGAKNQFFSTPTRFGSREQLQRCTAIDACQRHRRVSGRRRRIIATAGMISSTLSRRGRARREPAGFAKHPKCFYPERAAGSDCRPGF